MLMLQIQNAQHVIPKKGWTHTSPVHLPIYTLKSGFLRISMAKIGLELEASACIVLNGSNGPLMVSIETFHSTCSTLLQ